MSRDFLIEFDAEQEVDLAYTLLSSVKIKNKNVWYSEKKRNLYSYH